MLASPLHWKYLAQLHFNDRLFFYVFFFFGEVGLNFITAIVYRMQFCFPFIQNCIGDLKRNVGAKMRALSI